MGTTVIATFSAWRNGKRTPTNGMIEPLISFFGPKSKDIILIDCPHPGSDMILPVVEEYKNNKLVKQNIYKYIIPPLFILNKFNSLKTQPTFKLRDFLIIFQVLLFRKKSVDLYIGLESIHTLSGIILKKFGKVKKVVYYVSDYSPTRYSSKLFNDIYLRLDRYCAENADYVWDVSKAMMPARIKAGFDEKKSAPLIHVPNGLFKSQIEYLPIEKTIPNSLAFAGTIGPENGLDLAIEALYLAKNTIPDLQLHIFGGGLKEEEDKVSKIIKKYKLEKSVIHYGFISDLKELSNNLMKCQVGLAPYRAISWSVRWYADATKIRLYFANGLPVITTQVPPLGKEVEEKKAAIVVKDNPKEFSKAIIKMLTNRKKYINYRKAAINYAKDNTWENSYANALKQMSL